MGEEAEAGIIDYTFEKWDGIILATEGIRLEGIFLGCADVGSFVI